MVDSHSKVGAAQALGFWRITEHIDGLAQESIHPSFI